MKTYYWFSQISVKQRIWLVATVALMLAIVVIGFLMHPAAKSKKAITLRLGAAALNFSQGICETISRYGFEDKVDSTDRNRFCRSGPARWQPC